MIAFVNWNDRKIEVQNNIEKANITDKNAIKLIMLVMRKENSATNSRYDRGRSVEFVLGRYEDEKYMNAMKQLGNESYIYDYTNAPYYAEWVKFSQLNGNALSYNMCDVLA